MRYFLGLFIFWSLILTSTSTAFATESLYEKVHPATLEILIDGRLAGSGWFASPQGFAFTAAHLIKGFPKIEILSPVAGRLPAVLVATDLSADMALLRIERHGRYFPALPFAKSMSGHSEPLFLFGSPLYRHGLMMKGVLSSDKESFEWNDKNHDYTKILHIQALTPEGYSGGPWVNQEGEVVGLQSGMLTWKNQPLGIAFMSPILAAVRLIKEKQHVTVATLGASFAESWEIDTAQSQSEGITVLQLQRHSPLAAVGITQGDSIVDFNGERLLYRDQLIRLVRHLEPGTQVKLRVRDQKNEYRQVAIVLVALAPRL